MRELAHAFTSMSEPKLTDLNYRINYDNNNILNLCEQ